MSTAVPAAGRPASACAVAGPVVDEYWLGSREAVACLVRMEVLLSADMMMAVLFLVGHFITRRTWPTTASCGASSPR